MAKKAERPGMLPTLKVMGESSREDRRDARIARKRLREIKANPRRLVSGKRLEKKLGDMLDSAAARRIAASERK